MRFPEAVTTSDWHRSLRLDTQHLHEDTEEAFAPFDISVRSGYTAFLTAQAHAVLPLEAWLRRQDIVATLPDWPARERGPVLVADLAALGAPAPTLAGDPLDVDGALLGVVYVLEGSRHGGRFLVRTVQSSADPLVAATTRFLGQPGEPGAWRALLARIDAEASNPGRQAAMLAGARAAFGIFRHAALEVAQTIPRGVAGPQ